MSTVMTMESGSWAGTPHTLPPVSHAAYSSPAHTHCDVIDAGLQPSTAREASTHLDHLPPGQGGGLELGLYVQVCTLVVHNDQLKMLVFCHLIHLGGAEPERGCGFQR